MAAAERPTSGTTLTRTTGTWWSLARAAVVAAVVVALPLAGIGQDKAPADKPAAKGPEKKKIPAPEDVSVTTKDGVELQGTFYAGLKGKESVPVMLVHGYKGSRSDYKDLAPYLQSLGHAVLAIDLRGHGSSVRVKDAKLPLEAAKLKPNQFAAMIEMDLEKWKTFLTEKNNAGELNIDKLCVVGAEMGAIIALDWARLDWSWPVFATGKQGQDVKALVLLSPKRTMSGLNVNAAMRTQAVVKELSILLLYGKGESSASKDANLLHSQFERFHPEPADNDKEKKDDKDLYYIGIDTKLQGTKLLGERSLMVDQAIGDFIQRRLVNKPFPWKERKI